MSLPVQRPSVIITDIYGIDTKTVGADSPDLTDLADQFWSTMPDE